MNKKLNIKTINSENGVLCLTDALLPLFQFVEPVQFNAKDYIREYRSHKLECFGIFTIDKHYSYYITSYRSP